MSRHKTHLNTCTAGLGCSILCVFFTILLSGINSAFAQDNRFERPELTVRVTPAKPYLQEQILHSVRLVSAYRFAELEVEIPDVAGAETIIVTKPTVRPFRSYGVEGFIYETSRVLFPESSGVLKIPGVHINGAVSVAGQKVAFERKTKAIDMKIAPVPESYEGSWWLVSGLIEIREEYSQPLDVVRVGDTVRRTVTVTAKGSTGEHIPELEMRPSRGLTILPGTPTRSTDRSASGVTGIMQQPFDITVVESQPVDFGPIRLIWWDSEADAGRRSAARAVRIEPLPRDVQAIKSQLMDRAHARVYASRLSLLIASILVAIILAAALFVLTSRRLLIQDRALLRIARSGATASQAMEAIYRWASISFPELPRVGIDEINSQLAPQLASELSRFSARAFGGNATDEAPEFNELAERLIRARQKRRPDRTKLQRWINWVLGKNVSLPTIDRSASPTSGSTGRSTG